jgi:hypothetical protein
MVAHDETIVEGQMTQDWNQTTTSDVNVYDFYTGGNFTAS